MNIYQKQNVRPGIMESITGPGGKHSHLSTKLNTSFCLLVISGSNLDFFFFFLTFHPHTSCTVSRLPFKPLFAQSSSSLLSSPCLPKSPPVPFLSPWQPWSLQFPYPKPPWLWCYCSEWHGSFFLLEVDGMADLGHGWDSSLLSTVALCPAQQRETGIKNCRKNLLKQLWSDCI